MMRHSEHTSQPVDAFRRLALSLPEAEERDHWGRPSFRVRGRIFATLWPEELRGVVKVSREEMVALAEADPATFTAKPWGPSSWLSITLSNAEPGELGELLVEAWRGVAPKRTVAAYDRRRAQQSSTGQEQA
jgi:hypothetical protein